MDGTLKCTFAWVVCVTLQLLLQAGLAHAADGGDDDLQGYDSIVNQLNHEAGHPATSRARIQATQPDSFDGIWFHGGVGVATLMETLDFDDGAEIFLGQKGIQISGGIDLFSPNWMAEGTMRNFGETDETSTHVSLKEFELKVIYHDQFARHLGFHAGGGLTARYMSVRRPKIADQEYVTPTSVAVLGLDYYLAEHLSVGIEGAARNAMISDTIDRNSYDATVRVDLQL